MRSASRRSPFWRSCTRVETPTRRCVIWADSRVESELEIAEKIEIPRPGCNQFLSRWEDFLEAVERIQSAYPDPDPDPLLFRGQSDAKWSLATTLERWAPHSTRIVDYYQTIGVIKFEIETFTERTWNIPDWNAIRQLFNDYDTASRELTFGSIPAYEYITHLRHHGFPSPLLDWTRSPFIAAFFAFSDCMPNTEVSIYVYNERPNRVKGSSSNAPTITTFGPNVRTHKRHFFQQSQYSICSHYHDDHWYFEEHDTVFRRHNDHQDLLWKFSLPSSERVKVMGLLDTYNLNAFSLFGSEESLMRMLAERATRNSPIFS